MSFEYSELKGRRVLITGASSGIGAAIAKYFGACGARVGVHYGKNRTHAMEVLREIRESGGDGKLFCGDLRTEKVAKNLTMDFIHAFGGIDVLVNNAGALHTYRHFSELDGEMLKSAFTLHALAPFLLMQDAFVPMQKQRFGRIINISTNALAYAGSHTLHYCASKAALEAISAGFAREGAKDNVLVNVVRCGLIDTPMHTKTPEYDMARWKKRIKMIPIGHAGSPDDIARTVLFLASAGGDFITGEVITIAGGE
ncbi:MAG: 3-oxoacyl-[acyl-carrier protein] reductase [Parcubacteria group bacterium Gr01-1014_70]|nr:MAG: 3-oxoacyl-[acyl-carrier protein] reductase [Parcubacteria group bacterium Gr01-1014_70]